MSTLDERMLRSSLEDLEEQIFDIVKFPLGVPAFASQKEAIDLLVAMVLANRALRKGKDIREAYERLSSARMETLFFR